MTDTPVTVETLQARVEALEAVVTQRLNQIEAAVVTVAPAPAADAPTWKYLGFKVLTDGVKAAWGVLDGFKSVVFYVLAIGASIADAMGAIDLTPVFSAILPAGSKVTPAVAVVLMSFAGILLRSITKSPLFGDKVND